MKKKYCIWKYGNISSHSVYKFFRFTSFSDSFAFETHCFSLHRIHPKNYLYSFLNALMHLSENWFNLFEIYELAVKKVIEYRNLKQNSFHNYFLSNLSNFLLQCFICYQYGINCIAFFLYILYNILYLKNYYIILVIDI